MKILICYNLGPYVLVTFLFLASDQCIDNSPSIKEHLFDTLTMTVTNKRLRDALHVQGGRDASFYNIFLFFYFSFPCYPRDFPMIST
jgi:hypothetical protein